MTTKHGVGIAAGLAVLVLVVGVAAVVTYAQQAGTTSPQPTQHYASRRGPLAALRHGLAQLGLSDDQKQQIKGILQGHKTDLQTFSDRRRQARRALVDAIAGGETEAVIRQKSADLAQVQADFAVFAATLHKQVFAVLTPDQQAKAAALRAQARDRLDQFIAGRRRSLQ